MEIDHIFIITLPHRKDRLDKLTKQLDLFNLSYEVFNGVNGKYIKTKYNSDNMNVGCTASHGQVLQRAQIYGLNNCLVLEDDCELSDTFLQQIKDLDLKDYDICYLSGTHREKPIKVNDTISRCTKTLTTHAYIANLKSEILNNLESLLLNNFTMPYKEPYKQPVDCYFTDLQNDGTFYVLNKPAAWQIGGFSEINQREMYYEWIKDEL